MINDNQIRYIKFTPDYYSEVNESIMNELGYNEKNIGGLVGRWVNIQINNTVTAKRQVFSKVKTIEFIPEKNVNLYAKIFGLMSEFLK